MTRLSHPRKANMTWNGNEEFSKTYMISWSKTFANLRNIFPHESYTVISTSIVINKFYYHIQNLCKTTHVSQNEHVAGNESVNKPCVFKLIHFYSRHFNAKSSTTQNGFKPERNSKTHMISLGSFVFVYWNWATSTNCNTRFTEALLTKMPPSIFVTCFDLNDCWKSEKEISKIAKASRGLGQGQTCNGFFLKDPVQTAQMKDLMSLDRYNKWS